MVFMVAWCVGMGIDLTSDSDCGILVRLLVLFGFQMPYL